MENCNGCCGSCGGCGATLMLTPEEVQVLTVLEQTPFLPVARCIDDEIPVCREPELAHIPQLPLVLQILEKKMLIDLDYREALKGFAYDAYRDLSCHGSLALTARGQRILELLQIQGSSSIT